jgi:hypothetical protein
MFDDDDDGFDDYEDFDDTDDEDDDDDDQPDSDMEDDNEQSEHDVEDNSVEQSQSDDEEEIFQRILVAREARLDELRDYAEERELDEVQLLIPYCNPINQGVLYLKELIDFKGSTDLGTLSFDMILNLVLLSESPILEFQNQAKEYNINYDFSDDTEENKDYKKVYPLFSKFCMRYDPFKDFNQIIMKLKDDDRAISWNYLPKELEIKLGDIKQQLSLKNDFSYVGMIDYKAILPLAELEKYRETKGYLGKKIKLKGVRYIVWVTDKEFKKLGEICSQFDGKLEIFKQECTKLANRFMAECTEQQNSFKKSIAEEYENSLNKAKEQRKKLDQEKKFEKENYDKKKRNFTICRILLFFFSITAGLGISRIMSEESIKYGIISGFIIIVLGLIIIRKPKEPEIRKNKKMPPLPKKPVDKEVLNNKALDIFIDVLSKETLRAEDRVQIGTTELNSDNGVIK